MRTTVPKAMQAKYDQIAALTDAVCRQHLNEEYAELARQAAAKLARKRPSPLVNGPAKSWACGIVYALGQVNWLFDRTQTPHLSAAELCEAFGVAPSTGGNRAKAVRDALKMSWYNAEWVLPSKIDENPMVWTISVNGFVVDARAMPFPVQLEAYQKGLIPYIPGADMEQLDRLIDTLGHIQLFSLEEDLEDSAQDHGSAPDEGR
jgi:hypothetical protein